MQTYTRTKYGCYLCSISLAALSALSPLLFMTFMEQYHISYTLLGFLVLANFCTQLLLELVLSFSEKHLNVGKLLTLMPLLIVIGLTVYSIGPLLYPDHAYPFLLVGTIFFSASSGFSEALCSPVMAAIPAEHPDREMSRYHSVYAWGSVGVVLINTLFLFFVGSRYWYILALFWTILPIATTILFSGATIPDLHGSGDQKKGGFSFKNPLLLLFILSMFFGGAAEVTIAQWCSGYIETALGVEKLWGDLFGMALFSCMLGVGRVLYAARGKQIYRVLLLSFLSATVCYLVAALTPYPIVGLLACAISGICVAMLWPGNLIYVEKVIPTAGVAVYSLLACGGDLGASVVPQMVGSITDAVKASSYFASLALRFGLTADQIGLKVGFLVAGIFPLLGFFTLLVLHRRHKASTR